MSARGILAGLLGMSALWPVAGCEFYNCEEGADCDDHWDETARVHERDQCLGYCARVSVCGGPRADDLEDCVDACLDRFEAVPEETAALAECAAWSACSDVIEGRCSPRPDEGPAAGACDGMSCTDGDAGPAPGPAPDAAMTAGGSPIGAGGDSGASSSCSVAAPSTAPPM